MILRFRLKNLVFLGKMKAEKFASTAVSGYVQIMNVTTFQMAKNDV